ncbi:hypothetical protein TYRP_004002 [Tyrophagus putrescentiae]|nr:hypothetical protein TYRP_004002 [Tyrophagus putrescentiae]
MTIIISRIFFLKRRTDNDTFVFDTPNFSVSAAAAEPSTFLRISEGTLMSTTTSLSLERDR